MYIASYAVGLHSFVQGVVCLNRFPATTGPSEWYDTLRQLIRLSESLPNCFIALRASVLNGRVALTVILSTRKDADAELRSTIASFTRLETYLSDSVSIPHSRQSHDAIIQTFPEYHCRIPISSYSVEDIWFACDFRLANFLEDFLWQANIAGHNLTYQVNISRFQPSPDLLKSAKVNYLRMLNLPGIPKVSAELQCALVDRLFTCRNICEEFLAVPQVNAAQFVQRLLSHEFEKRYGFHKLETPSFEFSPNSYQQSLSTGIHLSNCDMLAADELCSSIIGEEEQFRVLTSCRRMGVDGFIPRRESERLMSETANNTNLRDPTIPSYDNKYIFVSYKHEDWDTVAGVLSRVETEGYKVWYDMYIPGGAEWDELIETRITNCAFVLLFVTSASINSKYVRREVKFADAINKRVLAIMLEEAELHTGMKMLLNQYQFLRAQAPDFELQLSESIKLLGKQ